MSLHELETAVTQLPAEELTAFAQWFEEYLADAWDRRIEEDIQAGRLDEAVQLVLEADGWHVDYEVKDPRLKGGGPHYVIDATTGVILTRRYEQ